MLGISCGRKDTTYYLYGHFSEYSLGQFEDYFMSKNVAFEVIANRCEKDIKQILSQTKNHKILLTSAHPYVPIRMQEGPTHPIPSLSIAKLRSLTRWRRVFFFSHDPLDEIKSIEHPFIKDYDALFLYHPERYESISRQIPMFTYSYPTNSLNLKLNHDAIFFPSEWQFYTQNFSPSEFVNRFSFLNSKTIGLKPPYMQENSDYLKGLENLGVVIIDPEISAEEIIFNYRGNLVTNASSGVIQIARDMDRSIILLKDFPLLEMVESTDSLVEVLREPFTLEKIQPLFTTELSMGKMSNSVFEVSDLDATYRKICELSK
jgi:hypothetical protein